MLMMMIVRVIAMDHVIQVVMVVMMVAATAAVWNDVLVCVIVSICFIISENIIFPLQWFMTGSPDT